MKRTALTLTLAIALCAGLAPPGSAARPKQSPVVFLTGVISAIAANDYGSAWQTLYPVHKLVAPEDEYVACEQLSPIPLRLASVVPVSSHPKRIAVAGLHGRRIRGVVASFRLHWTDGEGGASWTSTLTAAAVPVGDHWTWMLPRARYELYRDDACTAGESPP